MRNGQENGEQSTGTRKALVISVSDYANNLQSLDFCVKDGEEIYKVLKSIGYEIPDNHKLVGQVKYETMKDTIYDFFTDTNTKTEDILLFYYSGHGVPDVNGDVFLASSEINHDAPFRKGFSFYELTNTIERSNSTRIVTILDCCYSGAAKISKGHEEDAARLGTVAIDDKSRKLLQQGEGKCLLAASMGYQEAYGLKEKGHSIFTYYLLEGFRGTKKAVDEEGNVTPDTLGKYVYREIVNLPKGKRPKQKPIRKVEAGGDIILAQYPELVKKEPTQDPYESIQDATEFLKKGDYSSAVQYSDKAISINPRIVVAYSIKGQSLFNLERYNEALACYDKALELRPKYIEVINNRALTLNTLGKYDKAIESFNQSTDLNPNDPTIWNSKGVVFNEIGKYNEAIECFDRAIKLNPTYTEALKNEHIALSNLRQERHQEQKQQQQSQIGSSISRTSNKVDNNITAAYNTKDVEKSTTDRLMDLVTSKNVTPSIEPPSIKDKTEEEEVPKPKEAVASSPIFPSLSNTIHHPASTEKARREEVAGQTTPKTTKDDISPLHATEESNKLVGSPIGPSPIERTDMSQSINDTSTSVSGGEEEKRKEYNYPTVEKQPQQKNLKLLIPIIVVAVVGSIIAFAVFSTTEQQKQQYSFARAWSLEGENPSDVAVGYSGGVSTVYVTLAVNDVNRFNDRIQKFDSNGTFITAWGLEGSEYGLNGLNYSFPSGVAIDSSGDVYVADTGLHLINKFTSDGTFITAWGSEGAGHGQFDKPAGIAIDSSGDLYVTDWGNSRIDKFTSDGTFITAWGSEGTGNGQFAQPGGIAIDSSNGVYVADWGNSRINKFTSDGTFITAWGSEGAGNGQFDHPGGIAIDLSGDVYVADTDNARIQKFDSDGTFITAWGSEGAGHGQFDKPTGIAVKNSGHVYVADYENRRIQIFAPNA